MMRSFEKIKLQESRFVDSRIVRDPASEYCTEYCSACQAETLEINYDTNVGKRILQVLKCEPDFIGQINADTQQETTFQEMRERSVKCALWLKKNGISAKNIVAISTRNQMDVYVPFLACLYINAIAYIWNNVSFDREKPLAIISRTNPDVIFIQDCYVPQLLRAIRMLPKYRVKLLHEKKIVTFGETEEFTSLESILRETVRSEEIDEFSCTECGLRDTAIMMYTTSTLCCLEEIRLPYISFISPSNQFPPTMMPGDIGLWCEPFWWTYSPLLTVRSILAKVTAIKTLTDTYNLEVIFQLIQKYKVKWVFIKYYVSHEIKNIEHIVKKYDISSLREFAYDCPDVQCRDVKVKHLTYLPKRISCCRVYGTAETGVLLTDMCQGGEQQTSLFIFGFINKNVKVIFLDFDTKKCVDPGEVGEIWCQTPCVTTNARHRDMIVPGWFCTGDFGYVNIYGAVFTGGKISHSVRYASPSGERFFCSGFELEVDLLLEHESKVSHVVVVPLTDNRVSVFVWTKPGEKVTKEELQETLKTKYRYLNYTIIRVTAYYLPLYPNGEINRREVESLRYVHQLHKKKNKMQEERTYN